METKDHLYLAKLITGTSEFGGKIKKTAFEYGCIYPDINPATYIKGHTYSGTFSFVRNVITRLYGKIRTSVDYFNLGQAVHFLGDYFTFPHTPYFSGTLSEHRNYEHILHEHITSSVSDITADKYKMIPNSAICIKLIEKFVKKYAESKNSVSGDWKKILFICSTISLSSIKV